MSLNLCSLRSTSWRETGSFETLYCGPRCWLVSIYVASSKHGIQVQHYMDQHNNVWEPEIQLSLQKPPIQPKAWFILMTKTLSKWEFVWWSRGDDGGWQQERPTMEQCLKQLTRLTLRLKMLTGRESQCGTSVPKKSLKSRYKVTVTWLCTYMYVHLYIIHVKTRCD